MNSIQNQLSALKPELLKSLEDDILTFWIDKTIDHENSGFIGNVNHDNIPQRNANKGVILNTRILWTFSAVCNYFESEEYCNYAERALGYINNHFIDRKFGGVYWELNHKGIPVNRRKQIYAQAFAIYSLTEYYKITQDKGVLDQAIQLYRLIEKYSYDSKLKGYIEAFREDWSDIKDFRLSDKDLNAPKTMNTHLHILEAYTNLYRIWENKELKNSLRLLILLFLEKFIDNRGHLILFFDKKWSQIGDLCSYGHDIEFSWLLTEAAHVINDQALIDRTREIAVKIADLTLKEGVDKDGGIMCEYNYTKKKRDTDRHWWMQAEALVGFFNAFQITRNEKYLEAMFKQWDFIDKYIIDHENGEWFWKVNKNGTVYSGMEKAGFWKCPYHNTRAILELLERI